MPEKNYNIIFEKLEEISKKDLNNHDFLEEPTKSRIEYDEIKELCRLSIESDEQRQCFFTTT